MLATLILGIAAGAFSQHAEPHLKGPLNSVLASDEPMGAVELRTLSFAVCLLAAALLAYVFGNGSAIWLAVGAAIGVFWPRLFAVVQKRRAPDYEE